MLTTGTMRHLKEFLCHVVSLVMLTHFKGIAAGDCDNRMG